LQRGTKRDKSKYAWLEQVLVRLCSKFLLVFHLVLDFREFELDEFDIRVTFPVHLSENLKSFFVTALVDEPARGFWEPD
jgi:hypothetical protein